MTRRHAAIAGAVLFWIAAQAAPASADAFEVCRGASSPEQRLAACSAVIESPAHAADQKAHAYRNRGRARAEAGAHDAALADLGEAIRLNGLDSQALSYRAQVHVTRGDLASAIADFGEVIRLRPNAAIGYSGRGHAYLVKGDAKDALADFSAALRLTPGSATAHNNRGLAHKAAGELDKAIADFTAALGINPIYALAYNNRAYAHEAAGRRAEAIADFKSALLADPSLAGAREGLARLGAAAAFAAESERLVEEGRALVETHCNSCHAVARDGDSPNRKAPPFRTLHARHPMQALREPLTRGIAAPHDEMPKFRLPDAQIDRIVAYINSLERR